MDSVPAVEPDSVTTFRDDIAPVGFPFTFVIDEFKMTNEVLIRDVYDALPLSYGAMF